MKKILNEIITMICTLTLITGLVTFTKQISVGAEEQASVTPVYNVNGVGGINSVNVSWMPELDTIQQIEAGKTVSFYVYLDGGTEPVKVVTDPYITRSGTRVQTESNNSSWYGEGQTDQYGTGISALTGVTNGKTVKYNTVTMPDNGAFEATVRYSTTSQAVCSNNPRIKMYVDSEWDDTLWNQELSLSLTDKQSWSYYKEKTITLNDKFEGSHKISLKFVSTAQYVANIDWIEFSRPVYNAKITGVSAGTHTIEVKACVDGTLSESTVAADSVQVAGEPSCISSDTITVAGFQIKTNDTSSSVGFRTVCNAPSVGAKITVDNTEYTVAKIGTIYSLDINTGGLKKDNFLDDSYTVLSDTNVNPNDDASLPSYYGLNTYNGQRRTYGYLASEGGVFEEKNGYSSYVRTMVGVNNFTTNSMLVRAFVVATDGTIIYGSDTACVSVLQAASYLYKNSKASNYVGHEYLYSTLLSKYDYKYGNPYFIDSYSKVNYGWNDNLYTPED